MPPKNKTKQVLGFGQSQGISQAGTQTLLGARTALHLHVPTLPPPLSSPAPRRIVSPRAPCPARARPCRTPGCSCSWTASGRRGWVSLNKGRGRGRGAGQAVARADGLSCTRRAGRYGGRRAGRRAGRWVGDAARFLGQISGQPPMNDDRGHGP